MTRITHHTLMRWGFVAMLAGMAIAGIVGWLT